MPACRYARHIRLPIGCQADKERASKNQKAGQIDCGRERFMKNKRTDGNTNHLLQIVQNRCRAGPNQLNGTHHQHYGHRPCGKGYSSGASGTCQAYRKGFSTDQKQRAIGNAGRQIKIEQLYAGRKLGKAGLFAGNKVDAIKHA